MSRWNYKLLLIGLALGAFSQPTPRMAQTQTITPKIAVEADGTVKAPARSVPPSALLSKRGKQYLSERLHQM